MRLRVTLFPRRRGANAWALMIVAGNTRKYAGLSRSHGCDCGCGLLDAASTRGVAAGHRPTARLTLLRRHHGSNACTTSSATVEDREREANAGPAHGEALAIRRRSKRSGWRLWVMTLAVQESAVLAAAGNRRMAGPRIFDIEQPR